MKPLTTEFLHELFEYKDGVLYNKVDRHTSKAGERSGFVRKNGYWQVKIGRSNHYAHRIIYQMHHGESPEIIDHIDGDPANNRIENLRPADFVKNGRNCVTPKNNTTGVKNVYLHKPSGKFHVRLFIDKKPRSFGYYEEFELAELVAIEARNKYYKEFARHA